MYSSTRKNTGLFVTLFVLIGLSIIISAVVGTANINAGDVTDVILSILFPFLNIESSDFAHTVFVELRLPRILLALLGGMGFAISGTAMQGILRNPLASPFTIGISAAAGFGASLAIIMNTGIIGNADWMVICNSFAFAIFSALFVYSIAKFKGIRPDNIILAGIAIMYFFSACTSMLQYIATDNQLKGVVHWMFGNLAVANYQNITIVSCVMLICIPIILKNSWGLNALADGVETAMSLGVNPQRVRVTVLITSSAITAMIICFTGIIGFICLGAPHISRLIVGNDHRYLIPFSGFVGALLLLISDTIGRTVLSPAEVPVGIITSFIGVPLFVWLIINKKNRVNR